MLKSTRSSRRTDACASKRNEEASTDTTAETKRFIEQEEEADKAHKMFLELQAADDAAKKSLHYKQYWAQMLKGKNS